jgi:hypothetical protein
LLLKSGRPLLFKFGEPLLLKFENAVAFPIWKTAAF